MIIDMLNHYESHMEVKAPVECIAAQECCHIVAPPAPPLSPQIYKEKKIEKKIQIFTSLLLLEATDFAWSSY